MASIMETRSDEKGQEKNLNTCQPWPWLVVVSHESHSHILFSLVKKDDHGLYTRGIPDMCGKFIINCCHRGWLVIEEEEEEDEEDKTNSNKHHSLLNLISMQRIQLPTLKFASGNHICVMSSPPTDSNFRVVFISYRGDVIFSWQLRQEFLFCQQQLIFEDAEEDDEDFNFLDAINFDGKVYGIIFPTYSLVYADFADPNLCFRRLIRGGESLANLLPHISTTHGYLVESCGQVLYVHKTCIGSEVVNFQIFRADISKLCCWVKLQSIGGDRVIFLDNWRGVSSPPATQCGIKGNTIVFTQNKNRNLYTFDMEDQSISITLPNPLSDVDPNKSAFYWILI